MKKFAKIFAVAALALTFGLNALAAPSASTSGAIVEGAKDAQGADVTAAIVVTEVSGQEAQEAAPIKTAGNLKAVLEAAGKEYNENMTVVDLKEVEVVGDKEVTFPLTITFKVPGAKAGMKGYVLHLNGTWEDVTTAIGDGTMTGTFTSLSPVAFVLEKQAETPAGNASSTPAGPATGVPFAWTALVAAAAFAGMAVLAVTKKRA